MLSVLRRTARVISPLGVVLDSLSSPLVVRVTGYSLHSFRILLPGWNFP